MSDSLRPHGLQPTRLLRPWDFPGKSTGAGCHCPWCAPVNICEGDFKLQSAIQAFSSSHPFFFLLLVPSYFANYFETEIFKGSILGASLMAQMIKNLPVMQETDLIPGSRRSSGEGSGNPVQCSCLENPMDRGAWWATVLGVAKSRTQLRD